MNMKFLELKAEDAFNFCAVLDAVAIQNVVAAFDKEELAAMKADSKNSREIGAYVAAKIIGVILKNLSSAREEIYQFLADCTVWENGVPVTKNDLKSMKIGDFAKLLKAFTEKEDLQDFLSEISGFASMEQTNSENLSTEDTSMQTVISKKASEPTG